MSTTAGIPTLAAPERRRGCLFYVKRIVTWLIILVVVLVAGGIVFQLVAAESDKRGYPPSGQMVNVSGHLMNINCTGEGDPTVILDTGAFSFSTEWYWVQRQLEATNRVCSYDRAGNGWSEAVAGDRDGLTLVRELHALLAEADVPGPYVLVGHSLGAVLNVIYASQYPDEVLGTVLVDSAIPRVWSDETAYQQYKSQNESAYLLMTALTHVGLTRVIIGREFQGYGYPSAATAELTAFKSTTQAVNTWDAEVRLAQWDLSQQFQAASNLGALPVVVLWASHPELTAPEDRETLKAIWELMPVLSSNRVIRVVGGSDHGSIIGSEQYAQLVTDAAREVINAAQTGEPLAQ